MDHQQQYEKVAVVQVPKANAAVAGLAKATGIPVDRNIFSKIRQPPEWKALEKEYRVLGSEYARISYCHSIRQQNLHGPMIS